jgi:phage antirepressor YoqD-like protein
MEERMNDIIKVNYESDRPTVLGRDLHAMLEVGTAYKDWFPRMCEYGFSDGSDFSSFLSESTGGRPATDHQLTIDMAKEICMLQRTEKGKTCREYFISIEKQWNRPEAVMARALQFADRQIKELTAKVEQDKPKVLFASAVETSKTSILIGELAKLIRQNGVEIGQNRLFQWLRDNGYLIKRQGTDYNMPTQYSVERGWFEIKETVINKPDGSITVSRTPKITGKGQTYFINLFL